MGFGPLDYAAMILYLALIIGIGAYTMRGQRKVEDFFLGGRRLHWLPVGISLFASLLSANSYISAPAEAYNHGITLYLKTVFVLLGVPLAIWIFVRTFRRLALTTAYEYLERRFDLRVRLLASFLFILLRSFYLGVVLFAPSIALEPATGWPPWFSILLIGVVATVYTVLGGIKSVVWTDVAQFTILFGGIVLTLGVLAGQHPDGLAGIWDYARARGHTFDDLRQGSFYSLSPFVRLSFWALLVSAIFTKLGAAGTDQITVQFYLSTRSVKDASRSMIWGALLGLPVMFLLYVTGLGLLYFYAVHPERMSSGMTGDQALGRFISHELPPGVGGVVMAAILAAVMSTVDAGLNSLSTCTMNDFWKRLWRPQASEAEQIRMARRLTLFWGVVAMLCANGIMWFFGADRQRSPLVEVAEVTINFFTGVLLGVFLLGVLTRRAHAKGVLVGAAAGLASVLAITVPYHVLDRPADAPKMSFLWINITGCLATSFAGYVVSLVWGRPKNGPADGSGFPVVERSF